MFIKSSNEENEIINIDKVIRYNKKNIKGVYASYNIQFHTKNELLCWYYADEETRDKDYRLLLKYNTNDFSLIGG